MKRVPKSDDADSPWARLLELDHARIQLARAPARYPIGPGPIEQFMAAGLTPMDMIERCRSPDLQAFISPMYLLCLAYDATSKTHTEAWPEGIRLSRFVAEGALAWEPEAEIDERILEVVREHLSAAGSALRQELDETIFSQAVALAETFLGGRCADADRAGQAVVSGRDLHAGALRGLFRLLASGAHDLRIVLAARGDGFARRGVPERPAALPRAAPRPRP